MRASCVRSASVTSRLICADQGGVHGAEDQIVDAATEIRPHHPLALGGGENDVDRLLDVVLVGDRANPAGVGLDHEWESPSAPEEFLALLVHRSPHPISTVGAPMAIGLGAPASTT